jgi:MFS transporter, DHA1 family, multidrug resistance protein
MKVNLKILLWSSFLINLAAGLFGPIYAVFVEQIGGDLITAGSAYAAFSIATGVLILAFSRWEDRVKHQEKLLVAGRFLSIIGFVGYLYIQNPIHLFIVQIIFGIAASIEVPAYDSLYSKNLTKGKFASGWGIWEAMYAIVTGISAIIGGYIAQTHGFQTLFIIMLILSIGSFIVTLSLLKKRKKYNALQKTR